MVAVGDGAGRVGVALASATAVPDAVQRAVKYAKEKIKSVAIMKKLLGIVVLGFCRILEMKLEMDEIKQGLD